MNATQIRSSIDAAIFAADQYVRVLKEPES